MTTALRAALIPTVTAALVQVRSWAAKTRAAPSLVAPICVVRVTRACGRSQAAGMCTSSAVVPAPVSARPIATGTAKDRVKADRPDWRAHTGAQATAISSPTTRYRNGRIPGSPRTSDPTAAASRHSC